MEDHVQLSIYEDDYEGVIQIFTDKGAEKVASDFADRQKVASMLGLSRASSYRVMAQLPRYKVHDHRPNGLPYVITVVRCSDILKYKPQPKGNPLFANPAWQRMIAKRPRKKGIDN